MIRRLRLIADRSGAAAIETAIALPVLVVLIYGIFTLGQIFQANAGMQHALGEGARYGNLCLSVTNGSCTMPTGTQLAQRVRNSQFGTGNGTFATPTIDTSTASSGYVTITVRFQQTLNFILFSKSVTLSQSKRVYLADTPPTSSACASAGSSAPVSCSIYN